MNSEELLRNNVRTITKQGLEQGKLTEEQHDHLLLLPLETLDELGEAYKLIQYCLLVNRIEKGEKMIAAETDPKKKEQYKRLLIQLTNELEGMIHVL